MDLSRLVVDDAARGLFRVHRASMTSPEILDLERQRIFERCWLYVGHETEVPASGDYRRRMVAGRPLFMVRGPDGAVRVFINSCRHRGALVCRTDEGNAETFECFYHGWTYNSRGDLVGVPDPSGYAEAFDRAQHGLIQAPHTASYRGMVFVHFGREADSLEAYLGEEMRSLIDLTFDSAEVVGGWSVLGGTAKYDIRANWKLLVENSSDNYHFRTVHKTYMDYLTERRERAGAGRPRPRQGGTRSFVGRNGHVAMATRPEGRTIASPSPIWSAEANAEVARVRAELVRRFGEERGASMAEVSRFLIIFPNLAFHDTQTGFKLRVWWPTAPDRMTVSQWELVPRAEHPLLHAYRQEGTVTFQGPGGFGTPDDVEALESCQTGYRAPELEWSDISRGMRRDEPRDDDELAARGFWRQWHAMIQGLPRADHIGDPPVPSRGAPPPAATGLAA